MNFRPCAWKSIGTVGAPSSTAMNVPGISMRGSGSGAASDAQAGSARPQNDSARTSRSTPDSVPGAGSPVEPQKPSSSPALGAITSALNGNV